MKNERRDCPRRVTPALLDFYIKRGHELRDEAWRDVVREMWEFLVRLKSRCLTPRS